MRPADSGGPQLGPEAGVDWYMREAQRCSGAQLLPIGHVRQYALLGKAAVYSRAGQAAFITTLREQDRYEVLLLTAAGSVWRARSARRKL